MNEALPHRVYLKQLWESDWEEEVNLFAESFAICHEFRHRRAMQYKLLTVEIVLREKQRIFHQVDQMRS